MKIVFAGTPDFAVPSLQALLHSQHEVVGVYTQPDRKAGRGQKLSESPVKQLALANDLPVFQPSNLRNAEAQQQLADLEPDLMIIVAYGLILPQAVLDIPQYGCMNVHGSLLPLWRGAAPIQRAIEADDEQTGVTIMQLDAGMDTGPMLKKVVYTLNPEDTSASVYPILAALGAEALVQVVEQLEQGELNPEAQNDLEATHAAKITKQEALINWQESAKQIGNKVRAFNPWPVCYFEYNNERVRVWQCEVVKTATDKTPGTIVSQTPTGIDIATADGLLRILELQLPGKTRMSVKNFLNARPKGL